MTKTKIEGGALKEIKICWMSQYGKTPRGIYVFKEPNIWYPVVYFRKSKCADKKLYEIVMGYIRSKFK